MYRNYQKIKQILLVTNQMVICGCFAFPFATRLMLESLFFLAFATRYGSFEMSTAEQGRNVLLQGILRE